MPTKNRPTQAEPLLNTIARKLGKVAGQFVRTTQHLKDDPSAAAAFVTDSGVKAASAEGGKALIKASGKPSPESAADKSSRRKPKKSAATLGKAKLSTSRKKKR